MAGIGDYTSKSFSLKSGNKPSFKEMGSSPLRKEGMDRDYYKRKEKERKNLAKKTIKDAKEAKSEDPYKNKGKYVEPSTTKKDNKSLTKKKKAREDKIPKRDTKTVYPFSDMPEVKV